ncbi:hypothetical protein Q7P36_009366 [Cladosporium allicinum]
MALSAANRLQIGNLLYQVQPEEILDVFKKEEISIDNLDISIDPFSGRNPSYCFVDLASTESAEAVIQKLQTQTIRGRPVKVRYDRGKCDCSEAFQLKTRMQNGEWKTFDFTPSAARPSISDRFEWKEAREHWNRRRPEANLFEASDLQAVSKRVLPVHGDLQIPATGQCYCFVDLTTAEEAGAAMAALNGMPTPCGGVYKINVAYGQEDRKVCREQAGILGIKVISTDRKRNLDGNWRSNI